MRIGIDSHFLEKHYGGLTTYLKGILKEISEIDELNEYFLFFQHFNPVKLVKQFKLSDKLNQLKTLNKINWFRWFNFILPRQLKDYKIDLFFSPNHFLPIKRAAKKEVVVVHDLAWKINPEWKNPSFRIYAELFQKKSIQRADKIIVDSEKTKRDVMKYYSVNELTNSNINELKKKIEVVYLAADEEFKPRELSQESKLSLLRKLSIFDNLSSLKSLKNLPAVILYVGRIERRKNIQGIIEIANKIRKLDRFKDLKFILFGPVGPGGNQFLNVIRNTKNIQYKGVAKDKDLSYIYNLSKIFLFPSFYEGFGISPLEAIQSGVPVLVSNTSSLPEVVGQGGLMHDPKNYEGFAKDITRLLEENEFYQEMRKRGIEQAKKFSWRKTAEKLVTMFNGI